MASPLESAQQVVTVEPVAAATVATVPRTRSLEDLRWHFPMLNDRERNEKYVAAVGAAVEEARRRLRAAGDAARGVSVLDVGAGSALLAIAAARAGATHVTACEADPLVAAAAERVIGAHGLESVVRLHPIHSTELSADMMIGGPADVVTHEIVDSTLLGEAVLPALRDAWSRGLLRRGAISVPFGATLSAQLVASPMLWARRHPEASMMLGADGRAAAQGCPVSGVAHSVEASAWHPESGSLSGGSDGGGDRSGADGGQPGARNRWGRVREVSEPFVAFEFEFGRTIPERQRNELRVRARQAQSRAAHSEDADRRAESQQSADAVLYWWTMQLLSPANHRAAAELQLCTSWHPRRGSRGGAAPPREHWWQAVCVLDRQCSVHSGEGGRLIACRDDDTVWFSVPGDSSAPPPNNLSTESRCAAHDNGDGKRQKVWQERDQRPDPVPSSSPPPRPQEQEHQRRRRQLGCSCPGALHTACPPWRLAQLQDPARAARYAAATLMILSCTATGVCVCSG
jgi:predicted RNA methylase